VTRLRVNVDGGARGNPGPAAIGVVIRSGEEVVAEVSERIGEATNNVAEYRALLAGIARAGELGATELELVGDSELVSNRSAASTRSRTRGSGPSTPRSSMRSVPSSPGRSSTSVGKKMPRPTPW
jgi:ribonuclease HI